MARGAERQQEGGQGREERLEDWEEGGKGEEVQDDTGDVIWGSAVLSLRAGNQVTEHDLGEADAFTAPAAQQPPPRGNAAR